MGIRCDRGSIFCCYDISCLYFVIIAFMHSGSDCGFTFIKLIELHIIRQNDFQNDKINSECLNKIDYITYVVDKIFYHARILLKCMVSFSLRISACKL